MTRFALRQADLFTPSATTEVTSARPPLAELTDLFAGLRVAKQLPWPDAAATMAEERRALGLARLAGAEGEKLAAAILDETERLLAAGDHDTAPAPPRPF